MAEIRTGKRGAWMIAGVCLLAVVAVVLGVAGRGGEEEKVSLLPDELSAESLKAQAAEDPGKLREVIERHDPDEMTEEQRRELRENMREARHTMMASRMEEYFAAAEADRQAILDKQIDEFQKMMAERRQRRQEREGREDKERPNRRDRFGSQTREERKANSENRNPDEMAQRMSYFDAMRRRMQERGIEMPWGGRGRGGGPGRGGPGGGGGGGGRGPGHG